MLCGKRTGCYFFGISGPFVWKKKPLGQTPGELAHLTLRNHCSPKVHAAKEASAKTGLARLTAHFLEPGDLRQIATIVEYLAKLKADVI